MVTSFQQQEFDIVSKQVIVRGLDSGKMFERNSAHLKRVPRNDIEGNEGTADRRDEDDEEDFHGFADVMDQGHLEGKGDASII